MADYPIKKHIGLTEEMATRLAIASDQRDKSETFLVREYVDRGLTDWESAQEPKGGGR